MNRFSLSILAPVALVAALVPGALAQEGKTADYTFQKAPVNSMGIKSLAELRGKPVVIDFWGKN